MNITNEEIKTLEQRASDAKIKEDVAYRNLLVLQGKASGVLDEIARAEQYLKDLNSRVDVLESKNNKYKKERDSLVSKISELKVVLDKLENNRKELDGIINNKQEEISVIEDEYSKKEKDLIEREKTIKMREKKIRTEEGSLNKKLALIKEFASKL